MKRPIILLLVLFASTRAAPVSTPQENKLAFSLAQPEDEVSSTQKKSGFWGVLQDISENTYVRDFLSFMKIVGANADQAASSTPVPYARAAPSRTFHNPVPLPTGEAQAFHHSLSLDDSVKVVPSRPANSQTAKKNIGQEEWAQTLFGERGVLTGIFQMMDQQRKSHVQSDPTAQINGKPIDLKGIFDQLFMTQPKGQLGDESSPELPEFLGICNRLSCGDIYKAIDKFRHSEFFSNFQTAMTLVQDPNGWETIGKLLSNPELIAQFTAGSGMSELFGSALEGAKKESSKTKDKNSKILPEDGDFGTDFTDMEEGSEKIGPQVEKKPKIDFSVDGSMTDYYEEVAKGTNITPDVDEGEVETVDVAPPPPPPARPVTSATKKPAVNGLPELSFSEDGNGEEGLTFEKSIDVMPEKRVSGTIHRKSIGLSGHSSTVVTTTRRNFVRTLPSRPSSTTTTMRTTTTTTPRTTIRITTTTTTKNFRKEDDYYAMYYDDQPR